MTCSNKLSLLYLTFEDKTVLFFQVCQIELGFQRNEIQQIVFKTPKVLTASKKRLKQIFDYLHNIMGIPHHMLARFPQVSC